MEEKDSKETEKEWDGKIEETHSEKLKSEKDECKDVDKDKIAKMATLIRAIMALKMTKEDKQPSEDSFAIVDAGSIGSAMSKDIMKNLGITHVLVCAANLNPPFESDFNYLTIPILDKPKANVMIYFEKTNEYIKNALENDGKVLVHCFAGISRSSTFVLAFLLGVKNMVLADAFKLLKEKRSKCDPNIGFMVQLKVYEKGLFGKCSKFEWRAPKQTEDNIEKEVLGGEKIEDLKEE